MILSLFRIVSICVVGVGLAAAVGAQVPTKTPTEESEVIRVDTELIDVPVVVTDKNGKAILDLKLSNFVLYEDGKQQEIADFAATTVPFQVALLLDTSGSTRSDLDLIIRSAQAFIDALRPGDRVALVSFGSDEDASGRAVPQVIAPLTDDRSRLRSALQRVTTSNGTPYYDALVKAGETVFASESGRPVSGRRAIVALTDGVDSTSVSEFTEAREILDEKGIISYFIRVDTRTFFESELLGDCQSAIRFSQAQIRRYYRLVGSKNMEQAANFCQLGDFERLAASKALYELADAQMHTLARSSGGKMFPVGDLSEARNAFRMVASEIGTNYSLGYYSSNEKKDGSYRKIRVVLKGLPLGSQLRHREGYTAGRN